MITVAGQPQMVILAGMTSLSTDTFRQRVEAAAAAGFDGVGIPLATYRGVIADEMSAEDLKLLLDDNGLVLAELEAVFGFAVAVERTGVDFGGGLSYTSPAELQEFWAIAEVFGSRHLQVVGAFDRDDLESDAVERFAGICDRAAEVGLKVALEFVPTTNIPDAATALSIIDQAGRPNAGLCVDAWHHTRGANDHEVLRSIEPGSVTMIQVNDGPREPVDPDFLSETLHHRQVPGDGEFDLHGFVEALTAGGVSAPISVEVISDELAALTPNDAARRCFEGTVKLFG